jgi:2-amino-4-hydroxy-6-hydroxymethyldihydropteridine diphosphokinase
MKTVPVRAYIGVGSNLGDRLAALQAAVDGLAVAPGVTVVAVSAVYETAPVGGPEQPDYLNAVVVLDSERSPRELLELGQRLEADAQRVRRERWGPRTLDVDVLLVGTAEVDDPDLQVPHPRLWARGFVVAPLADVAPEVVAAAGLDPDARWSGVRRTDLSLRVPEPGPAPRQGAGSRGCSREPPH